MNNEDYSDFVYPSSEDKLLFSNKFSYVNPDYECAFYRNGISVIEVNPKKRRKYSNAKLRGVLFIDGCGLLQINGEEKGDLIMDYFKRIRDKYSSEENVLKLLSDNDLETIFKTALKKYKSIVLTGKTKKVVFSEWCMLTRNEKRSRTAKLVGKMKSEKTVFNLKQTYKSGMKQHELAAQAGKSLRTIKKYWKQII